MKDNGVVISNKEMYDMIQRMAGSLQRIEARLDQMEEKMESTHNADERSREALNKAEDALDLAKKIEKKHDWAWKATVSTLITTGIGVLFYFVQGG